VYSVQIYHLFIIVSALTLYSEQIKMMMMMMKSDDQLLRESEKVGRFRVYDSTKVYQ